MIALINSKAVVKKCLRQRGRVILRSTNPKYSEIEIAESDHFVIAGVVHRIVVGTVQASKKTVGQGHGRKNRNILQQLDIPMHIENMP